MTADGNNHLSGFSYDASGNASGDGVNSYTWNAESQLKVTAGSTYIYDGDGRRVAKANTAVPPVPYKLYWYGAGGEVLAETDGSGNTNNSSFNEYIFFGGQRVAMITNGGSPTYYVEDLLGTSRITTTNTGVVCYDADFYPFGGERPYTNTCSQNYKFEGKERDTETGNDDFGARYYSNRFGRWLSADWSAVPVAVPYANLSNPQTLNLYSMVVDDPESFADLDGHCCLAEGAEAGFEIGSIFGPIGEAIGTVVGAGVGALAGSAVADYVISHPNDVQYPCDPGCQQGKQLAQKYMQNENTSQSQQPNQNGSSTDNQSTTSDPDQKPDKPYKRPNNATTQEQRDSVQNKPCATCGATGQKNNADHKDPLVKEYYRNGTIDEDKMRSPGAVQPQCQNCSNQQGGWLSNFSKKMKKALFGS
jgi:RHS repeat-associated protein